MEHELEDLQELPRNQASRRQHRRQSWLQIGLPFALAVILLTALIIWLVTSGTGEVGSLAQIATMLLAGVGLFLGLFTLGFLVMGIYALARLMNWLPPQAFRLQRAIRQVNARVVQVSDVAAKPILLLDSWGKAAERVFRRRQ